MWEEILYYSKLLLASIVIVAIYEGLRYLIGESYDMEALLDKNKRIYKRIRPLLISIALAFTVMVIYTHVKGKIPI